MLPEEIEAIILQYLFELMEHDQRIERTARASHAKIVTHFKRIKIRPLYGYWWFGAHVSQRVFVLERFGRGLWGLVRTPCFHCLLD